MANMVSLTRFIMEQQREQPGASGTFTLLLNDIVKACKQISYMVNRGDLIGVLGSADSENVQGEVQKKLDILTNEVMIDALSWTGHLAGMASEEVNNIIRIPKRYPRGKYLVLFDPLDGSSNIDVNLTVGTIFSILRHEQSEEPTMTDFLQPGHKQVAAGFVLYGPSTMLVLTTGHGVNGFTLNQDIGEFILTHPDMTIPAETSEFAINMSRQRFWEAPVRTYVEECVQGKTGPRGRNFNMRWVASLVAEVFRILTRGGVFLYPYDTENTTRAGKLRLMYEANPMAYIIEQAGGACITGRQRVLDIQPEELHQRVPLILGSKKEVEYLQSLHN